MSAKKLLANVFSNWTNLVITIAIAFYVSPILVHGLGDDLYGVWVLIISITGYFTVLDLGVNTAVIRFISRHEAAGDRIESRRVFSTSMGLFLIIGIVTGVITIAFSPLFFKLFGSPDYPKVKILFVFIIVGVDMALGFLISVYIATLKALQQFVRVNLVAIVARVLKNTLIVVLLMNDYSLLAMGCVHFGETLFRLMTYWWVVRPTFRFHREEFSRPLLGTLLNYSVYSLIISVVTKLVFYTDSVLVGSLVGRSSIVFYSIPVTLLLYLERLVYAMISVLTPIVSSNEARSDFAGNQEIYRFGTRYSLIVIAPILAVLYLFGGDFISLWMGPEYGERSAPVLQVLCVGYFAYASQIIANGVLKGISKHKVFAWILVAEAVANLVLSIVLGRRYGIVGIAYGASIALAVANLVFVPAYACAVLRLSFFRYWIEAYGLPLALIAPVFFVHRQLGFEAQSYWQFLGVSAGVGLYYLIVSAAFLVEPKHRARMLAKFRRR